MQQSERKMAKIFHPLLLFLLINALHRCQSQLVEPNGFRLKLNRINSHDHPFPDTIRPAVTRSYYLFTIDATIGTPSSIKTFIFDTGSSLIWTQCKPCVRCFKQDYPLFDPKQSSSYQKLPPNHALKSFFKRSSSGDFVFNMSYESGQSASGFAAVESLSFAGSKRGSRESIKGVVFGCTNNYQGQFTGNGLVTGIMGMNRSPLSLVGQMGAKAAPRFSYCLPTLKSAIKSTFLRFGSDVSVKWSFQKTRFISSGFSSDYRVKLVDISVVGRRLNLPRGTFPKGCILDVGSAASTLEMGAYTPVLNAVKQHLDRFNLTRAISDPRTEGDLCYRLKPGFKNYATMTLHFEGAKLEVGADNLFRVIGDRFCLALFGSKHLTLLGAYQQQNVRLVYDVANRKLLFGKEDCSKDKA